MRNQLVLFIEDRHPAAEISDNEVGSTNVERGWQPELIVLGPVERFDVFALKREPLQAVVGAVGDQDQRLFAARIDYDRVRSVERSEERRVRKGGRARL